MITVTKVSSSEVDLSEGMEEARIAFKEMERAGRVNPHLTYLGENYVGTMDKCYGEIMTYVVNVRDYVNGEDGKLVYSKVVKEESEAIDILKHWEPIRIQN